MALQPDLCDILWANKGLDFCPMWPQRPQETPLFLQYTREQKSAQRDGKGHSCGGLPRGSLKWLITENGEAPGQGRKWNIDTNVSHITKRTVALPAADSWVYEIKCRQVASCGFFQCHTDKKSAHSLAHLGSFSSVNSTLHNKVNSLRIFYILCAYKAFLLNELSGGARLWIYGKGLFTFATL